MSSLNDKPNIGQSLLLLLAFFFAISGLTAQSFGRNKPNYEQFDFKVYQSPHFELYTYLTDSTWRHDFLNDSEEWYHNHSRVLNDTIAFRNPMIIYGNHADFQQTNAISGSIGTGTGGVTEAFKNRVILPVAMTNQQTHHVLGHELVHAFQYDMVIRGDSTKLQDLQNIPLWMVEGLAEYLSIGGVDPFTAMWMRDAVLNQDVPSLKDLNSGKYFPYRYGQAFWAFVTGLKGDDIINPYFRNTARLGLEASTKLVLGYEFDEFSKLWQQALQRQYEPYVGKPDSSQENFIGRAVVNQKNGGRINVAPEISPNGRYIIYLSEKDLFSVDLFLADARTGKPIRKIDTRQRGGHIDDINYIENSGSWSPNGREFVYTAVSQGDNVLLIANVEKGRNDRKIKPAGLPAFNNPAWSPNGRSILVTGLVNGQTDLYLIDVRSERVTRLTNDRASETHPSWSADGEKIYFSTDELALTSGNTSYGAKRFNLAQLDVESGQITHFSNVFPGADNLNPTESTDGSIVFLSNRDGFRNIYRLNPVTGEVFQLTDLLTGVSGITHYAPAISMDRKNDRLVYTYFNQRGYRIYQAKIDEFLNRQLDPAAVDLSPATLPRLNPRAPLVVDNLLESMDQEPVLADSSIREVPYRSKFKLDYAGGSTGVGIGNNPIFGTTGGLAGGADFLFTDILGNNQFFTSLRMNGELADFGGTVAYINRKNRLNWGASISRTAFRSAGSLQPRLDTLQFAENSFSEVINSPYVINRLFQNQTGVFAQYPISTTVRLEGSLNASLYTNRVTQYNRYFDPQFGQSIQVTGQRPERRRDLESESFFLGSGGVALVGDRSFFGLTAPIKGSRYRLALDRYFGEFGFNNVTADYRRYLRLGKFTLAGRAMHQGRYGGDSDDLFPQYVGSPWFVRGLRANEIAGTLANAGRSFDELVGSKLFVGNVELRIPFTGPEQIALFKSKFLFSDLNFFVDGGMAFNDFSQLNGPVVTLDQNGEPFINPVTNEPFIAVPGASPVFTVGASVRVNLFGSIILEPYYAKPLIEGSSWQFGLNVLPGW
ncbi:hypothetical protein CEQ90_19015 [Lewinellaceae bacterium SD302]|nr:hypothetical protein CEQ90_19015 [Lewinellaceae bacterium SD302]